MKKESTTSLSSVEEVHKKAERRSFLKKAAYTVPKLIALGYITRPSVGMAESRIGDGPGGPPGGGI